MADTSGTGGDGQPGLETLREATLQNQLSRIVYGLPDVVATFELDGKLLFLNQAGQQRFAIPEPEVETRSIRDLIPYEERDKILNQAVPFAYLQGEWKGESWFMAKDGELVDTSVHVVKHDLDSGRHYYSI